MRSRHLGFTSCSVSVRCMTSTRPQAQPSSNLPSPGPAWAGSLMGTSILATLSNMHGVPIVSPLLLVLGVGILCTLVAGWWHYREPGFSSQSMSQWGMTSMGILALGSAATGISGAVHWQLASWWIGAPLSWVVCIKQLQKFSGAPTFQWGLALVSPMVAATSAAQLASYVEAHSTFAAGLFHAAGTASFILALVTALPIFARCYVAAARRHLSIPPTMGGTAWIPLGIVGQSTAAAQLLFSEQVGAAYGATMIILGIGPMMYAARHFSRTVSRWAAYTPGWWGSTFPVGTLSLGTHFLSQTTGAVWLNGVSQMLLVVLALHWMVCAVRFIVWLIHERSTQQTPAPGH